MLHPIRALGLAALVALGTAATCPASATFNFSFDNTFDGTLTPPFVGTGTVTLSGNTAPGTYALTSFASFSMAFAFNDGHSYGTANIATPLSQVLVVLYTVGVQEQMYFSNTNPFGTGPSGGSIDFVSGSNILTFEPPGFGSVPLNLYQESNANGSFAGTYGATIGAPVPEPSTLALCGTSIAGLVACKLRRKARA